MKKTIFIGFVLSFVLVSGDAGAEEATAFIKGTEEGSTVSGVVFLEDTEGGLRIKAGLLNVTPGTHGFHIHQNGSCANAGVAAGGHYNPEGSNHGLLKRHGFAGAHAGDLGNIVISPDGTGAYGGVLPRLSLSEGKYIVAGRAIILHAKPDDFGQPTGNAGGRIGCGVIEL